MSPNHEQLAEDFIRNVPYLLWNFQKKLIEQGFTSEQAMPLVNTLLSNLTKGKENDE